MTHMKTVKTPTLVAVLAVLIGYISPAASAGAAPPAELLQETPGSTNTTASIHEQAVKRIIRDRFREYSDILDADFAEAIIKWRETMVSRRETVVRKASQEVVFSANRMRELQKLDASQVRAHPAFRSLVAAKVQQVLEPAALRSDLVAWAKTVEDQTRSRMIECFQQVVAEDLGRSFDENLKGQVVKAIRGISVEALVTNVESVAKIEQAIISAMPEAAISESSRKIISQAAVSLTSLVAYSMSAQYLPSDSAIMLANAAGVIVRLSVDSYLFELNEAKTPKPDADAIGDSLKAALGEWNDSNLQPRLQAILTQFRSEVILHAENHARQEISIQLQ